MTGDLTSDERATKGGSALRTVVILVASIFVAVPALLFLWIGLVLWLDDASAEVSANQIFAWMIAAIVAVVLWPITLNAFHRMMHDASVNPRSEGRLGRKYPRVPSGEWTVAQQFGRGLIVVLGGIALLAVCGPQEITLALLRGISAISPGERVSWASLQFLAFVFVMITLLPGFLLMDRQLRRLPRDDPGRPALQVRQSWYLGATLAWVACVMLGFLFGWAILATL